MRLRSLCLVCVGSDPYVIAGKDVVESFKAYEDASDESDFLGQE